ncbi:MAG: O-antigen ligase family protein [Pseudomonadota bacterium]
MRRLQSADPRMVKPLAVTSVPCPVAIVFAVAVSLFCMQPIAPEIRQIPLQIFLIALVFLWYLLTRLSVLLYACTSIGPVQWTGIMALIGTRTLRLATDDAEILFLFQLLTGVIIALIGYLTWRNHRARLIVLRLFSVVIAISAVVAILQYVTPFTSLWSWTTYRGVGYVYGSAGLESNPVSFAYSVVGMAAVVIGAAIVWYRYSIRLMPFRPLTLIALCFAVAGALMAANSRSGMLGLAVAAFWVACGRIELFSNRRNKMAFRAAVVVGIAVLIHFADSAREKGVFEDARITATWSAYLPVIVNNPVGLPLASSMLEAISNANAEADERMKGKDGRIISPHNLLLSCGLSYGPFGSLGLILIYASAFVRGLRALRLFRRDHRSVDAAWVLVLMAANAAVLSHCWFHNASIALGEMRNWLWLGFLAGASRP